MRLDRAPRQMQSSGDVRVAQALAEKEQDL